MLKFILVFIIFSSKSYSSLYEDWAKNLSAGLSSLSKQEFSSFGIKSYGVNLSIGMENKVFLESVTYGFSINHSYIFGDTNLDGEKNKVIHNSTNLSLDLNIAISGTVKVNGSAGIAIVSQKLDKDLSGNQLIASNNLFNFYNDQSKFISYGLSYYFGGDLSTSKMFLNIKKFDFLDADNMSEILISIGNSWD